MCEFCKEHGEGKKWYFEMKNYSEELLHEELTAAQKRDVGADTRYEWTNRFWRGFVMPAITGVEDSDESGFAERKVSHCCTLNCACWTALLFSILYTKVSAYFALELA